MTSSQTNQCFDPPLSVTLLSVGDLASMHVQHIVILTIIKFMGNTEVKTVE